MAAPQKHFDEAREGAVAALVQYLASAPEVSGAAILNDLFGRISVTLWVSDPSAFDAARTSLPASLAEACAQYWTGTIAVSDVTTPREETDTLRRAVWDEGVPVDDRDQLRLNDRHRHHTGWFLGADDREQLWRLEDGPPVIAFYGFKGGAGRTTLLASYAMACAQRGERVAIVDLDLDAPGIGTLLAADDQGVTARWGTVDFLLESAFQLPLDDYFHTCTNVAISGAGRLEVFPTALLDDAYLPKLARVDLNVRDHVRAHPLGVLLQRIREERAPAVILLDGRAGLSPAAGLLLSGIAHLHVLVATSNPGSLSGLERVVRHLGYDQARAELPQRECIVVQAHVPDSSDAARTAREHFASRVEWMFRAGYYSQEPTDDDRTWSLEDLGSAIAPHVPVPISYRGRLAHFSDLGEVAALLTTDPEYVELHHRIDERLGRHAVGSDPAGEEGARG